MVAQNPPGVTGFGPAVGPANADGTPFIDTVDFTPVLYPQQAASGPAQPVTINPVSVADTQGMPGGLALIIEMRLLNYLTNLQLGSAAIDLDALRANELFRITIGTGTVGGDMN